MYGGVCCGDGGSAVRRKQKCLTFRSKDKLKCGRVVFPRAKRKRNKLHTNKQSAKKRKKKNY